MDHTKIEFCFTKSFWFTKKSLIHERTAVFIWYTKEDKTQKTRLKLDHLEIKTQILSKLYQWKNYCGTLIFPRHTYIFPKQHLVHISTAHSYISMVHSYISMVHSYICTANSYISMVHSYISTAHLHISMAHLLAFDGPAYHKRSSTLLVVC